MQYETDPRFDAVHDLGQLRKLYKPRALLPISPFGPIILLLGMLWLLLMVQDLRHPVGSLIARDFFITALAGLGAWEWWSNHKKAAALYEGGLAYHDGRRLLELRWEQMRGLEEKVTRLFDGRQERTVLTAVIVRADPGRVIQISRALAGFDELAGIIKRKLRK